LEQSDATICIPAYGAAELTDACLLTVVMTCSPAEVLIWDNGIEHQDLTNGTKVEETRCLDRIYARSEEGRILSKGVWNLGFAEACNRMAADAKSDLLVFLNCDTEPQDGWLEALVREFDDPAVAVAGPKMVSPDGTIRHAGIKVTLGGGWAWSAEEEEDLPTRDVGAVTGACMAVRTSVFRELGGLDTSFIMIFEDVDFCLRVVQAGHRIRYVRESLVMHHVMPTGPERYAHSWQGLKRFREKWGNATLA